MSDDYIEKMKNFRYNQEVRAVVETKRVAGKVIHNAEVAFADRHYVVSKNHATYEDAQAAAQVYVDRIIEEWDTIRSVIMSCFAMAKE